MDLLIPVSKELAEHGLVVGKKIYEDKLNFRDKTQWGGSSELQADVYGFIAEAVVCDFFNKPLPQLTRQSNDDYDVLLKGFKIDVKKVGFDKWKLKPKIWMNKKQFFRKREKIDGFLFCTFRGGFESKKIRIDGYKGDIKIKQELKVWVPVAGKCKLLLAGWIKTEDVEANSKTTLLKDKDGNVKDELLTVKEESLLDVKELMENA